MRWWWFILVLLLAPPVVRAANTYYVGTSGSNGNPCAPNDPGTRKRTINAGIGCLSGGDTLVIGNGTYTETITDYPGTGGYAVRPPNGGSFATATTLKAENTLGAVLHFDAAIDSGWVFMVDFDSATGATSYLILDGILFDGQFAAGSIVTGDQAAHHIRVSNSELANAREMAVGSGGGPNWEFLNLHIHHSAWQGTGDATCAIGNCPTLCGGQTNFCQQYADIYSWAKCHGYCHAFYWYGNAALIEGCHIHDNDDHGVQLYASNATIRNNYIHDHPNPAVGLYGSGSAVYNNVFVNNGYGVIMNANNTVNGNTTVDYNNAPNVPGFSTAGGIYQKPGTTSTIKNNLVLNQPSYLFIDDGSGNNLLASSSPAQVAGNMCDTAAPGCTASSGPYFVSPATGNYHNVSGAPQINAGVTLAAPYNVDKDGNARTAPYDIGAYEGTGATGTPVATSLAFTQQPSTTVTGAVISPSPTVQVLDQYGTPISGTVTVSVSLTPNAGALGGTTNQSTGGGTTATFANLTVSIAGSGYQLYATAPGITGATSAAFTVAAVPAGPSRGFRLEPDPFTAWSVLRTDPAVNRQHPLLQGARHWWHVHPLLTGGTRWWDLLAAQHGTLTSMTPPTGGWQPTTRPGGAGELRLNGTTSTVALPLATGTLSVTGQYTWVFLIKPGAFAEWSGLLATIATPGDGSQPYLLLYAHTTTDSAFGPVTNGLSVGWHGTGTGNHLDLHTVNNVLTAGVWAQVALTYDGTLPQASRMALWVNGTDQTDTADIDNTGTLASITPTAVQLGQDTFGGDAYWQGAMDDVLRFDRILTQEELAGLKALAEQGWPGVLNRTPLVPRTEYALQVPTNRKRGGFFQWGQ